MILPILAKVQNVHIDGILEINYSSLLQVQYRTGGFRHCDPTDDTLFAVIFYQIVQKDSSFLFLR
jgi:hypothetical protein